MSPSASVLVVGSIMQDLTLACEAFPAAGQTVMGRMTIGQGGKGSNQAIACGRCGVTTTFVGAVGRDAFATRVREFYHREKTGCSLATKVGVSTGTAVILLDGEGQNKIVIEPGANLHLAPEDVPSHLWKHARVLVVQLEANLQTTTQLLQHARRAGVTTVLNPAPMRRDFDPTLLANVDVLIPNESEFVELVARLHLVKRKKLTERELDALSSERLHQICRDFKVPTLIVTLGKRGCFVSKANGFHLLPAHEEMQVVDTTGAGDAFCGGFAAGLIRCAGDELKAAQLGNAVAALSVTKPGAASAMPKLAAIRRFARQRRLPFKME